MSMTVSEPIAKLSYKEKVPVQAMKEILQVCIQEQLKDSRYDGEKAGEWSKTLSDSIKNKLKGLGYDRYKYVVQVVIGERREQGIRSGTRCFWDANTDNMASENYVNDYLFCVATAFAVYLY
jgi:tctex1 domain-containing protein 2